MFIYTGVYSGKRTCIVNKAEISLFERRLPSIYETINCVFCLDIYFPLDNRHWPTKYNNYSVGWSVTKQMEQFAIENAKRTRYNFRCRLSVLLNAYNLSADQLTKVRILPALHNVLGLGNFYNTSN